MKEGTHLRVERFVRARETMAKALETDPGLSIAYRSNVAMLVFDRYGIKDKLTRNALAKDVLELIFGAYLPDDPGEIIGPKEEEGST